MADEGNTSSYQRETVLNLHNSGIPAEIIALQMDISQEEIDKIIESAKAEEQRKNDTARSVLEAPSLASFYLDAVVDVDNAITIAQQRIWKALKVKSEFDLSTEETQSILEKFAKSKVNLVILSIDLVGSTRMSMTLPADRLATIVQSFTQEMSALISAYGGYVLKYTGDGILAFFVANPDGEFSLPSNNAVNCARSMIRVIQEGINPILNQSDYPEISVRVGIDVGENVVVQYGWDVHKIDGMKLKKPHLDILGYTISIAAKMTSLAQPNQIVIGQMVYDAVDEKEKSSFAALSINPEIWSYLSDYTGNIYRLYGTN